jgi:CheY-like chemotaxis protein
MPQAARVVIADNDPEVLDLLSMDLAAEGHQIVAQELQGDAALTRCIELRPDVLIVDYRMPPGPNGLEVAEQALALNDPPTVILFTNYRDAAIQLRAQQLKIEFLPKGNLRPLRRATLDAPTVSRD